MFRAISSVIGVCMLFCLCLSRSQAQDYAPLITIDNAEQVTLLGTFWQRLDEYQIFHYTRITWQLSNTGKWLVSQHPSCRKLDTFQIWSLENLRSQAQLQRGAASCRGNYASNQFSPDDNYFAAYSQCKHTDCGFQVWDLNTFEEIFSAVVHQFSQDGVALTSSGLLTVPFADRTSIRVYDIGENENADLLTHHEHEGWHPKYITVSPDGTMLAVQETELVTLLKIPEGTLIGTFAILPRSRTDMRFTEDSRYLILERYYRSTRTFWLDSRAELIKLDIETGEIVSHYALNPERAYNLTVSQNANYLLLRDLNQIELIHPASGEIIAIYNDERIMCAALPSVQCAQFNDAESLVAWISDDTIRIADVTDGHLVSKLPIGPDIYHMGFIPHTSVLVTVTPFVQSYLRSYPTCQIRLWDAQTGHEIGAPLVGLCKYFAISPDGTSIITADEQTAMVFGIPTETRPAYTSVPAYVRPSAITVRTEPDPNSDEIGALSGVTVVGGIDSTRQYLYIPNSDGWVRAGTSYIDLQPFASLEQLQVIP